MGRSGIFFFTLTAGLTAGGALCNDEPREIRVIRPAPCAAHGAFLLADNSGALIQPGIRGGAELSDHIIVFRPKSTSGWASQRLLQRFDLHLEEEGVRIVNSGAFCTRAGERQ